MVGVSSVYYFLADKGFPRNCLLQDGEADLCGGTAVDATTNTCIIDHTNPLSPWFSNPERCAQGAYPKCICGGTLACGAFVDYSKAFDAIQSFILRGPIVRRIYQRVVNNPIIGFAIALCFLLLARFTRNSLVVQQHASTDKEREYESTIRALSIKIKKQMKVISKLEMSHALIASPTAAGKGTGGLFSPTRTLRLPPPVPLSP